MARDHTPPSSPGRRSSAPAIRDAGGISAALELSPLPSLLIDDGGTLLACNRRFSEEVAVPRALLLGGAWWQAFATECASAVREAQRAMLAAREERGVGAVPVVHGDGAHAHLVFAWRRMSEPGTRRPVWILAVTRWERVSSVSRSSGRAVVSALTAGELGILVAQELDALAADMQRARISGATDAVAESSARALLARLRATSAGLRAMLAVPLAPDATRPGHFVAQALESLRDVASERTIQIADESRSLVAPTAIDPSRLLVHILANALEHSPPQRPVEVRTYDEPGFACVSVRDDGPGVPPEALAAAREGVFLAPAQQHPARGLAIVRSLAVAIGGTFAIHNDPAGGVVATLALPASGAAMGALPRRASSRGSGDPPPPAPMEPPSRPPAAESAGSPTGPSRLAERVVLVVDDDAPFARAIARLLRAAGADVSVAGCVAEARAALERRRYDVVVTDMALPDGDGLAVLDALPEPRPGAVLLSGQIDDAVRAAARERGVVALLQKPFEPPALVAALEAI